MKKFYTLLLLLFSFLLAIGQSDYRDIVTLKDGTTYYCIIIEEVADEYIKIRTSDNIVIKIKMDEVKRIKREEKVGDTYKQSTKRGFIGLEIGPNFPLGKFADLNNGLATTGLQINLINFGYLFSDHVGITLNWFGASNPMNGLSDQYMWSYGGVLAGPLFTIPISKSIEWDIRPMLGITWASVSNINTGIAYAIPFNFGTGLRFNMSRVIALTFDVDIKNANFQWVRFQQSMTTLTIKGGFAFRLN